MKTTFLTALLMSSQVALGARPEPKYACCMLSEDDGLAGNLMFMQRKENTPLKVFGALTIDAVDKETDMDYE